MEEHEQDICKELMHVPVMSFGLHYYALLWSTLVSVTRPATLMPITCVDGVVQLWPEGARRRQQMMKTQVLSTAQTPWTNCSRRFPT